MHWWELSLPVSVLFVVLSIVTADNCHPTDIPCSAPTGVLQPDGQWAIQAPNQGEQIVVHTIDLD